MASKKIPLIELPIYYQNAYEDTFFKYRFFKKIAIQLKTSTNSPPNARVYEVFLATTLLRTMQSETPPRQACLLEREGPFLLAESWTRNASLDEAGIYAAVRALWGGVLVSVVDKVSHLGLLFLLNQFRLLFQK